MSGVVHQLLPSFSPGDAIGTHVLRLRDLLRGAGLRSDIYCTTAHAALKDEARGYQKASFAAGDVLLYHLSCSDRMAGWLLEQPQRLLVDYHNITEPQFFDRWAPQPAHDMRLARMQLKALAARTAASVAHSSFSAGELVDAGYRDVHVAPLLFSVPDGPTRPARPVPPLGARWLFVGRLAPNKCQHDIIGALAAYRHLHDPDATLTLVGGRTVGSYAEALERLAADLDVSDAVRFTDHVSDAELEDAYRQADVFVCLSRHEGFGAPVVEAMGRGLPVVALAAAAVTETAGDAALLLADADPAAVAAAVRRLVDDRALAAELRRAGLDRAAGFRLDRAGPALVDRILAMADGG